MGWKGSVTLMVWFGEEACRARREWEASRRADGRRAARRLREQRRVACLSRRC